LQAISICEEKHRLQAGSYTANETPADPDEPSALRRSGEARNASQPDYLRKISADQRFTPFLP